MPAYLPIDRMNRRTWLARAGLFAWRRLLPAAAGGAAALIPRQFTPSSVIEAPALQNVLRYLGYLPEAHFTGELDVETERALIRFKRHARRPYRILAATGKPDDVPQHACFPGECDLALGEETVRELMQWMGRGWKLPLGRFKLVSLAGDDRKAPTSLRWTLLREDVAQAWLRVMKEAEELGGTLAGPYGDTWRPLGYHHKDGASRRSFHITGRAIDLNQAFAQEPRRRYYLIAETPRGRQFWRILCRTARQDGSQGRYLKGGAYPCWQFFSAASWPLPAGYYLDLTEILGRHQFQRVPAHEGWESNYMRTEWWHYHYAAGKQVTFLDECELIGISEQDLLVAGYTRDEIDRRPG